MRLTIALLLCAGVTAGQAQTVLLRGVVRDSATGVPLQGVRIESQRGMPRLTFTNERGRYLIAVHGPGPVEMRVTRIGYRPVVLTGQAGAQPLSVTLAALAVPLDPIIVTATRTGTAASAAPMASSVVDHRQQQDHVALSPIELVRTTPGMDVASKGLIQHAYAVRGERGSVSGALLTLTDYRNAEVPSLNLNIPYLIAATGEDIDRIEIVRGPGAALYGPGADRGVMHILTRSPFESPGATLTLTAGGREVAGASGRWAARLGGHFALKLSAEYLRGRDWTLVDPTDVAPRRPIVERAAGEARLDWRPDSRTEVIGAAGLADAISATELGGDIGTVQARGWRFGYVQARLRRDRLFINAFTNMSNAGDSYRLRNGLPIVDSSRIVALQLQHGRFLGPVDLLYGADARWTDPRTGGTIDGENESHDRMFELGAYAQATTALSARVDLTAALRADHHSALRDGVISPRLGVVFRPAPTQTARVTLNRGFTSPDANTLFIDALQQSLTPVGPGIRVGGVPRDGLTFRTDCGGPCGYSPFDPSGPHPITTAGLWPALLAAAGASGYDLSGVPVPSSAQVGVGLASLDPRSGFHPVSASAVADVAPLRRTITSTLELGWKGQLGRRASVTVDWYASRLNNVTGARYSPTPGAFYDATALRAYLGAYLTPGQADSVAAIAAQLPMAVVSPRETTHPGDIIILSRQGGSYTLWGFDVGGDYQVSSRLTLRGSLSWLNRNTATSAADTFVLGVPRRKGSLGVSWRDDLRGRGFGATARFVEGFDVNSGVYLGQVRGYGVVDAHFDTALPGMARATLSIEAQNIFDNRHREFVGAPALGRLILTRIRTEL